VVFVFEIKLFVGLDQSFPFIKLRREVFLTVAPPTIVLVDHQGGEGCVYEELTIGALFSHEEAHGILYIVQIMNLIVLRRHSLIIRLLQMNGRLRVVFREFCPGEVIHLSFERCRSPEEEGSHNQ